MTAPSGPQLWTTTVPKRPHARSRPATSTGPRHRAVGAAPCVHLGRRPPGDKRAHQLLRGGRWAASSERSRSETRVRRRADRAPASRGPVVGRGTEVPPAWSSTPPSWHATPTPHRERTGCGVPGPSSIRTLRLPRSMRWRSACRPRSTRGRAGRLRMCRVIYQVGHPCLRFHGKEAVTHRLPGEAYLHDRCRREVGSVRVTASEAQGVCEPRTGGLSVGARLRGGLSPR